MDGISRTFFNRRSAVLLLLGFSSGLPLAVSGDLVAAWLTDAKVDVARIGLLGLVGLPYALKFAWSPVVDRYVPPFLGRRRGWLLLTQLLLAGAIVGLSLTRPAASLAAVAVAATAVAFFSATQDIVVDAYRTDVLPPAERGPGAAVSVAGYRLGMIVSGAGALILVGRFHFSWPGACRVMAAALAVGAAGTLLAPEPDAPAVPRTLAEAVVTPLRELLLRPGGWLVVAFVFVFKLPEHLATAMSLPFLLKLGIAKADVGTVRQGLGVAVTIFGAFVGGGVVARLGIRRSLWMFGVLHSVSNLAFLALAEAGPRYGVMVGVIGVENLCIGLTTAGFTAWMMGQCDPRFSAFQFALLSGAMALARVLAAPLGGWMAHGLGWPLFFAASALFGLPGLLILPWLDREPAARGQEGLAVRRLAVEVADAAP